MIVRDMKSSDRAEVYDMMREFYDSPALLSQVTDEVLRKNIAACVGTSPFLEGHVMEHNSRIVGYGMVALSYSTERGGMCVWIEDVYIKAQFRRLGFGKAYFEFLEERYAGVALRLRLEAARDNASALKFYEKMGYVETEYCCMVKEK